MKRMSNQVPSICKSCIYWDKKCSLGEKPDSFNDSCIFYECSFIANCDEEEQE